MVRQVRRLLAAVTGALIVTACSLALVGAPAHAAGVAAPKPTPAGVAAPKPPPAGVDISGDRLGEPLRLRADTHPAEVGAVIDQVSWLGSTGQQRGPAADSLGPKYTVVVLAGEVARSTYDLYPLAKGGPRVYRPAKQPGAGKARAGWFFGRLNMSESLRTAGVPLERQFDTVTGGVGGGERVIPDDSMNAAEDIDEALGELQRLLLLNVGVMLVITFGLAGIALLIRRRTR